jgi:hypothetical protein
MRRLYRCVWCWGITATCCFIIGIPLLSVGAANIPYSLTREEIAIAGVNQGAFLEQKQRASAAWKQITVGAGFSFTALGMSFLLLCYCTGWLNRIGIAPDPDEVAPEPLEDPRPV